MLAVVVSMFVCDALGLVSCVFWSSGVASVNGGVASGLSGVLGLSVIRFSASVLGVEEGGCILEVWGTRNTDMFPAVCVLRALAVA